MDTGRSGADLLRRRDGSPLPVAWHTAAIRGEHGGIEGTVMTFRDVTREVELEAAREQALDEVTRQRLWLGAVIDQAPVGMILVESTDGERIRLNRLAHALCGGPMTLEGGVLRAPARVLRADRSPADASWLPLARALRGEAEASEELILGAGDTEVPVLMTATPVADAEGRRVGAVATMHDLRPIKELEREREEWLSVIAHDLRQPLSLILVRLGLLDRSQPPLLEQHRKSVGHMTSSAKRVDRLVSDLLDVSRIEANRLSLDILSVDTGRFLEEFVERQQPTTGGRPLVLVIDGPLPVIQADPARLEQVLANLVSNAVKYGRADTPIEIRATRTDDDGLLITVGNHGRGIPPAEQQRLFRRFYRIPETRRAGASGVGLGLYICKGLVEAHGGTISIESEPDGITRFHVRLPPRQPSGR